VSPLTGFEGIAKLPAGHYLLHENGKTTIHRYWEIRPSESVPADERDAEEQLDRLLREAVRGQMIADVPVGLFLSGGLDSSIIGALMRRNTEQEIHSFTIKYSQEDQRFEKAVDDSSFARRVANMFGFAYHELEVQPDVVDLLPKMVWHLDEPLADPAAINTYLISKAARERGIIVLLNGMGGDEVFGGYRKHLACLRADTYQAVVPAPIRHLLERGSTLLPVASTSQGFRSVRWGKRFLSFASLPPMERYLMSDLSLSEDRFHQLYRNPVPYRETHFFQSQCRRFSGSGASYLTTMCLNDTEVFLPELNLTYADKAAMAVGIEGRPPLTDTNVVRFMFTLPPSYRIRGHVQKYLLKKVAERYLPKQIVHRPKAPFGAPLRSWIRGPLAPMVDDLLSAESVRARGLYRSEYIRTLIENDRKGIEDNAHVLWTLLTNEIWFRTFFS
jgi:asparagine synthase (glutamine-hydrolysing)